MESRRGGQGGWGVKEPNAYERGGFFWTGSGVSQGTPIAHQDQRMRLAENEDVRRYAKQALEDKQHNLNVRDVDSRIRLADQRHEIDRDRFGIDERRFSMDEAFHPVRMEEGRQRIRINDQAEGRAERGVTLDERRTAADVELRQRDSGRQDAKLDYDLASGRLRDNLAVQDTGFRARGLDLEEKRTTADIDNANRTFGLQQKSLGLQEKQDQRQQDTHDDRWKVFEHEQGVKERQKREKGAATSNPERFLAFYDRATGGKAYAEGYAALNGKPNVSLEAQRYLNSVDELAMHPRRKDVDMQTIAQLAYLNAQVDAAGNVIVTDPKTGKRGIYDIPSSVQP
jgi:hypothetical protein